MNLMSIWTLIASGLQFLKLSEKHRKQSETPMIEDTQTESQTEIKVHKIIAGPFSTEDWPEWEESDPPVYWIEALVEFDGVMDELSIAHPEFDEIYKIVKHVNSSTIEPYVIGKPDE
jgi:hypothetical protein